MHPLSVPVPHEIHSAITDVCMAMLQVVTAKCMQLLKPPQAITMSKLQAMRVPSPRVSSTPQARTQAHPSGARLLKTGRCRVQAGASTAPLKGTLSATKATETKAMAISQGHKAMDRVHNQTHMQTAATNKVSLASWPQQ